MVELKGVSQLGFVPFSRMDATRLPEDAATKSTDMAHMVGEPIKTKIIQARDAHTARRCCVSLAFPQHYSDVLQALHVRISRNATRVIKPAFGTQSWQPRQ